MNNNEKESKDNLLSNEQQEFGGTILNKKWTTNCIFFEYDIRHNACYSLCS